MNYADEMADRATQDRIETLRLAGDMAYLDGLFQKARMLHEAARRLECELQRCRVVERLGR